MLRAPAKQSATETISVLSSRLVSATLLEDRRAAILGLRSFAKEYPASVASGALRALISCLTKDADDIDTIKVVLETLLALFEPSEKSLEASEDIALWLADEFSQRQDNITVLLDLLEKHDFYSRFYSLKLLQAIFVSRDERTQECILSAPLGTTRLVATLDDPRDPIRNSGLRLLAGLTEASPELQKLVAFENAFDRIFVLVDAEGSLSQGGIVVQDCLTLLHNLIRHNSANQSLFRETGGVAKLAKLLPNAQQQRSIIPEEEWSGPDKDKNVYGLLSVMRLFVEKGSISTQPNQTAFYKHGLLQLALNLSFDPTVNVYTRAEALNLCADMVRGNVPLQEGFAHFQVSPFTGQESRVTSPGRRNGARTPNGVAKIPVIEALLDLVLNSTSNQSFEARFAACECIKAYTFQHIQIRHHFLRHAINVHQSGNIDKSNVLTTLFTAGRDSNPADPYRLWFAAVLVFHLLYDDLEAKNMLMEVVEGDAENGEEVVTCIQTFTGNLVAALQGAEDERVSIAYLMLLCGWLFENAGAVNDFLGEGSSIQSLIQTASRASPDNVILRGLCATLLGTIYEFSTKDSPIPRRQLQPILTSKLGREKFLSAIYELRQHPLVRDFEVLSQEHSRNAAGLPEVFFDTTFVEFLKDNFSRLSRAIDRDPGIEIHQSKNEGVDRDLVDELRGQISEKTQALQKAEADLLTMERRLNQAETELKKNQETSVYELNRVKNINDALQKNHEGELQKMEAANRRNFQDLESRHRQEAQRIDAEHRKALQPLQTQLQKAQADIGIEVQKAKRPLEDELIRLKHVHEEVQQKLTRSMEEHRKAVEGIKGLQTMAQKSKAEHAEIQRTIASLQSTLEASENQITTLKSQNAELQKAVATSKQEAKAAADKHTQASTQSSKESQDAIDKLKHENEQLRSKSQDQVWGVKEAEEKARKAEAKAKEKEEEREKAQGELDDMLMLLADLEEKRSKDKARLKELGEEVSDGEDDDDDEEEDGEDEDEDEVE